MFTHSIRWRLLLWLGFLLVCVLTGFGFTVYQLQRVNQMNQIDEELERRVEALVASVRANMPKGPGGGGRSPFEKKPGEPGEMRPPGERGGPGPGERGGGGPGGPGGPMRRGRTEGGPPEPSSFSREFKLSPEFAGLFDDTSKDGYYYAVWSGESSTLKSSTNAPVAPPMPERLHGERGRAVRTRGNYREAFRFTGMNDCVLAGRPLLVQHEVERSFALMLLAAGGAVLAFGLGVSWWLTTRAIRPVEEISTAASRISAGNLSERINVGEPRNELGRLAGVLNSTFARLEAAFAQQKQFTADASHELRTPLAVIISECQATLARDRTSPEYRETVENCLEAAQQMRQISHALLALARFDAGQESIERARLDLAEVVRDSVELILPLARERGIIIHSDLAPAEMLGDAALLHQVITNLLANAIHYNQERGEIRVTTRAQGRDVLLAVSDTGTGISPEDLPHVFKRFYRADQSRSRADGRSGLGLAICQAVVNAHGGTIEVTSELGAGTTFTVRLTA